MSLKAFQTPRRCTVVCNLIKQDFKNSGESLERLSFYPLSQQEMGGHKNCLADIDTNTQDELITVDFHYQVPYIFPVSPKS